MRKVAIAVLAGLGLIGVAAFPQIAEPPAHAADEAAPPPPVQPGVPVTAGTVTAADVPLFLHGIGSVQAYNMVTIKSRVDGQIMKVNFTEGQEVRAGDPLFQIDPRTYQAALDQAQAAKAKDEVQLANAQLDLDRYSQLVGSGYQTRQSYDQQRAQVATLQAALKGDDAAIESAKVNLGYTDIRAPVDGRLSARLVDIGNIIHANDTNGLVTIAQIKPIFVSFTLSQNFLDQIREQQTKAPLVVRAYGDDDKKMLSEGKLTLIDNAIDQATGTIHLKASFDNQDERLWPGAFVNLRLILDTRSGVPTVPSQTVQVGPKGSYVYVIDDQEKAQRRPVDVTSVQDGIAVIGKGLKPGERVVVDGQYRLTDGARVKVEQPGQAGTAG
ncbi:MAG: efflux RND transporter periplasmic adaptor subunit [Alphaproteobacteria bacterium]|nr:efflux RND transporter periplasmic adaptor subunit [Alphaproteobacteria bacterium]